ncbi:MAG: ABC transporter permease subunit [Gemmataceae bacterium]|nr:ABC transporter permease subunit [Gemmataceae bacterium]
MSDPSPRIDTFGRLYRLVRKELSEILRDRRTMITLVAMPLLLYPLLSVAFQQFYRALDLGRGPEYRVGFRTDDEMGFFALTLNYVEGRFKDRPRFAGAIAEDPEGDLRSGKFDVVIEMPNLDMKKFRKLQWKATTLDKSPGGSSAQVWIERFVSAANERTLDETLPVDAGQRFSVGLQRELLTSPDGDGLVNFAAVIPLILILMTITGAVYPAIDLTAGERERNTLEILVAAPVPRLGLLFAKYVSVLTIAVLTALVNMIAMTVTVTASGLGAAFFGAGGLSVLILLQLFLLLLLFASFFSAVLLALTSFARSFKEAQAYLIPLMLLSLTPGMIGLMPGISLNVYLAATPLINIVLLSRDVLGGAPGQAPIDPFLAVMVVGSTLLYAAAAIGLAAKVFGDESVLYSEQTSWADLFRRPREPQPVATAAAGLWCLALMLPLFFVLQIIVQSLAITGTTALLIVPLLLAFILFGAWPALFASRGHVQWTTGFGLAPARWPAYLGALLLGISFWPVLFWVMQFVHFEMSEAFKEQYERLIATFKTIDPTTRILLAVALAMQGVLEEGFFRGYLFNSVRTLAKPWTTIVVTALLFGLLHLVMGGPLGIERVLPSTTLGLLLGWVAATSGSATTSMLQHAVHNALLIGLGFHTLGDAERVTHLQLGLGVLGTAVGIALVWLGRAKPADTQPL